MHCFRVGCDQLRGDFLPCVTPPTGAASRPRRKATRSTAPPQRGAPPEQGAAPTGAADSLPPAGAGVGAEDSPNCVKVVFCAPLRGLQLALFGGGDTTRPRPAAARCLPAETGELRQIPTFAPPAGFTVRAELCSSQPLRSAAACFKRCARRDSFAPLRGEKRASAHPSNKARAAQGSCASARGLQRWSNGERGSTTELQPNAAQQHNRTDQRASVRRSVATRGARQPFFFLSAQCAVTPRPCAGLAETLVSVYT